MRIHVILNLYIFKVKMLLGTLKASKTSIALLIFYTFGLLPGLFGLSLTLSNAVRETVDINPCIEQLSSIASLLMVFAISLALRGYIVFEYEQNIILTSPIKPREYLIADTFSNLTSLLIFANPIVIFYLMIVYLLKLSTSSALLILLSVLLFTFTLLFLKVSFSIVKSLYRGVLTNTFILATIFLLLFPSAGLISDLPIGYTLLPYPSTFLAKIIVGLVYGLDNLVIDLTGLSFYFLLSLLFFLSASMKNFFPSVSSIPFISPFDTSMRMQNLQMERSIRVFSRMGVISILNPESRSILVFLMKKEFIRVLREGSLFTIILLYLLASLIATSISGSLSQNQQILPYSLTFIVGVYSLTIPLMLVSNWRASDSGNLWIQLTSGMDIYVMVKALLYTFISLSSTIPVVVVAVLSMIYKVNPIAPLILTISTSMIGCSVNLYVMIGLIKLKGIGAPSLLIGLVSMLLSILLLTPVYILVMLELNLGFGDAKSWLSIVVVVAYSILITKILSKEIGKNIYNIEL
ncbi:MAG: hypothetical protein QW695_03675 [Candidatus Bathyarchaeia archaeon]